MTVSAPPGSGRARSASSDQRFLAVARRRRDEDRSLRAETHLELATERRCAGGHFEIELEIAGDRRRARAECGKA